MSERSTADSKIKSLEEQMTLSEDNISKVSGLVKILNSVNHTAWEKDLDKSINVILDFMFTKDVQESSYEYKIFSANCVEGSVKALGFKDNKRISNKFLITDFIKFLTVEDSLRDMGSLGWCKGHEIFMKNDFMKYLMTIVSHQTANISQKIFKCKKQYDVCGQKAVGDEFTILDSKIADVKSKFYISTFNLNLNNKTMLNSLKYQPKFLISKF